MSHQENDSKHSFIIFGNTGIGKSTFLNLISSSNHFKTSSSPKSCTKEVIVHEFQIDGVNMMSIDTPGLNDSNGIDEDQKNMKQLVDFLSKYEHGLNGIAVTISSSDCRFSPMIKKIIKLLHQIFGNDDFWFHLCFIVTHCPCYPEDLDELKNSMSLNQDSLKAKILNLIKNISCIIEDPPIPFFYVDSLHPNSLSSQEALPLFKEWFLGLSKFKTNNLKEPDLKYQYTEKQIQIETSHGEMHPIYDLIRGETQKVTIEESVPVVVKKKGYRFPTKRIEIIVCLLYPQYQKYEYEYEEIQYQVRKKTIEKPGDIQKVLKGYYQEVKLVTKSWNAYWGYDVDIIDKCNPTYVADFEVTDKLVIEYYDDQKKELSSNNDSDKISKLKELI